MSRDLVTISARVDEDSDLAQEFDQYQKQNSMTSKSEAVRHLIRSGLEQELQQPDNADDADSAQSDSAPADADNAPIISVDVIRGNEPIIIGFAFLVGFNDILSGLTTVAGRAGALLFMAIGLLLSAWILSDVIRSTSLWNRLNAADDDANAAMGAD